MVYSVWYLFNVFIGGVVAFIVPVNGQAVVATTTTKPSSWSQWSSWSDCSESCGVGSRFRARHCDGGNDCVGDVFQQSSCDNHCVIPVDGQWSRWGGWSSCSTSCGDGVQLRTRSCSNPAPKDGGKDCVGSRTDSQACKDRECPIDGGWSSFIARPCTATCGIGVLVSIRQCNNPPPQYGGDDCTGTSTKFEKCTLDPCVIDGEWSMWSDYTNCTAICGEGYIRRTRICNNPPPAAGGADCAGSATEKTICTRGACPKDIRVCDKTISSSPVCTSDQTSDEITLLKTYCKFPDDTSKWYLGTKIGDNCEMLPLYSPVGSTNQLTADKYGVMLECYNNNTIQIMSKSCDNQIFKESLDLRNSQLHMVSYHP